MNRKEINKVIDEIYRQGKSDIESVLQVISSQDYRFEKDEILEVFNSIYVKKGLITTPNNLCELIASIGKLTDAKSVIDICCGTGNILHYFYGIEKMQGIDVNNGIIQLAKYIHPQIEFTTADTLQYDFKDSKFDLVVGSLPFGVRTFDNKPLGIELMKKGLSLLTKNGIAIFIVNEGILTSPNLPEKIFREKVISDYSLDMVVSLPDGAFYPYAGVKTSIIVIRNGKPNEDIFMPSFEDNSSEIVANFQNKKGNFYLPASKLENRWDRFYYLSVVIIEEKLKGKEVKKLSEMAQIIRGQNLKKNLLKNSGKYLVYSAKDENGKKYFVDEINDESIALKPNDLVISLVGKDQKIYIHNSYSRETVITENFAILRSKNGYYINTYLQTQQGKDLLWRQAGAYSAGTVISRLTISDLADFRIPILPISEPNFVSEEWLRDASTKQFLQTKTALNLLTSIYDIGCLHLTLTNAIFLKVASQEERSKRIEEKLDLVLQNNNEKVDDTKVLPKTFKTKLSTEDLNTIKENLIKEDIIHKISDSDFTYLFTKQSITKEMKRLYWKGSMQLCHGFLSRTVYLGTQFDFKQVNNCIKFPVGKKLDSNNKPKSEHTNRTLLKKIYPF